MCGIAGIINFNGPEDKQNLLTNMIGLMQHRGPDASGIYIDGPVGLAHARLSIIDLTGGDQPIHNEDKTLWVVFNGEIFNYPELRKTLIDKGHKFYTNTDTEILIHLYEDHGDEMLQFLNGQFAFAIWDKKKDKLFLARDRVGIRPLFYYQNSNRIVFGSEIKAVFADNIIDRNLAPEIISDIFTAWTPMGNGTPFKKIYQLPPGHFAEFSKQGLNIQPYWKVSFKDSELDNSNKLSYWKERLEELVLDAARIRLRADVPVGAYLSGGIDSTYTSSLVKRNFNNRLNTFSVTFTDDRFNEASFQRKAICDLKTQHHEIRCSENDIGKAFPKIVWHTEMPIFRTAPTPLYFLSKLVRDNDFKVVLTGEGADEIFAGYNIFKEDRVRRFWAKRPESKQRPRLLEKLYPYIFANADARSKTFQQNFFKKGISETDSPIYSHMLRWQNTAMLQNFFADGFKSQMPGMNSFVDKYISFLPIDFMKWHPLSRAQYTEINLFLSNYLLSSQGDRMAMANSIEGRYPFLDHRVVEFATTIPPKYRMNGLTEKYILKESARGKIPQDLIDRPKQPYRAPISKCFFGEDAPSFVDEMLSETTIKKAGYFDHKKVTKLIEKCRKQDGNLLSERENMAVVGILSTQLLDDQFIQNFPFEPIKNPIKFNIYS